MLPGLYLFRFHSSIISNKNIIANIVSFYAAREDKCQTEPYQQTLNIHRIGVSFKRCLNVMDVLDLFSYNMDQGIYLCCNDLFGRDIKGHKSKTFSRRQYS